MYECKYEYFILNMYENNYHNTLYQLHYELLYLSKHVYNRKINIWTTIPHTSSFHLLPYTMVQPEQTDELHVHATCVLSR